MLSCFLATPHQGNSPDCIDIERSPALQIELQATDYCPGMGPADVSEKDCFSWGDPKGILIATDGGGLNGRSQHFGLEISGLSKDDGIFGLLQGL